MSSPHDVGALTSRQTATPSSSVTELSAQKTPSFRGANNAFLLKQKEKPFKWRRFNPRIEHQVHKMINQKLHTKWKKKKNLPEQCQGPYHNCFLTERVDKQAQDKARQRLVQKPCFLLLQVSKQEANRLETVLRIAWRKCCFLLPALAKSAYLSSSQHSLLQAG